MPYAEVAIACPLNRLFTYRIPAALEENVKEGMRLVVPFRNKQVIGICLGKTGQLPKGFSEKTLKEIASIKEESPIFSESMVALLLWLSDYYLAPIGEVCRAALPKRLLQIKTTAPTKLRLKEEQHDTFHDLETLQLTEEQKTAGQQLDSRFKTKDSMPTLLHGITGSGKTEIYLQFLKKVLDEGKQAILLVPEIGLTPQLIGRVKSRLYKNVAVYHSGLSEAWRYHYWEKMREGEIPIVVGTRSALFAPFPNLGAIIIDEEHDPSYKQGEGGFFYNARDAAIVRAKMEKATVVLGSATPSLETYHNAKKGKYHYIYLPRRATGASLPEITLIDLRKEKLADDSKILSRQLKEAIAENLYRGEQTLLFLNRRGFAHALICQDCGGVLRCPNCSIALTYHKTPPSLVCHYCDYHILVPEKCPHCQSGALKTLGEGTQTLEEELKKNFPEASIVRLDRDTTQKKGHRNEVLHKMKKGTVDILLGTQIVTKGHDFPNVTLVGVILADTSLCLPDFRATERTFQLLTQVAGRSGRAQKPGKVLIQTYYPENSSLVCAKDHNFETFSREELENREKLHYPPFSRVAQVRLQGNHEQKVKESAKALKKYLSQGVKQEEGSRLDILGPAQAPLAKLRGKYRWQILLKAHSVKKLNHFLKQTLVFAKENFPAQVQLQIDVDCLHMM